jgi:hypothetical protein
MRPYSTERNEIKVGAARLACTSLREGSRETRVSHHLPNDFTKSNESASALPRHFHQNRGNCLMMAKLRIWTLELSFLTLLHSQSIH